MYHHILYDRHLGSGLGDRLLCLVGVAAIATFNDPGAIVHYNWINTKGRTYNITRLAPALAIPSLSFTAKGYTYKWGAALWGRGELPPHSGYDCVPELIPKTFRGLSNINMNEFHQHYLSLSRQIFPSILNNNSEPYIVLHIRGTDKANRDKHCLPEIIDINTQKIKTVTDDVKYARNFVTYPLQHRSVKEDLAIILGASGIIIHSPHGWSAFSSMGSFFRSIPTISTAHDNKQLDLYRSAGAQLPGWYNCSTISDFFTSVHSHL